VKPTCPGCFKGKGRLSPGGSARRSPSWGGQFDRYVRDNLIATQRLLEALKEAPIDRLVFGKLFVTRCGDVPTKESALPRPVSPYGVTKLGRAPDPSVRQQLRRPAVSVR